MARTNVDVDDALIAIIKERFGVETKRDAIDLALRHLAGQPMTRDEALALEGQHLLGDVPRDAGPRG